ncbi:MAG: RraA family protein [Clostridiales bacterium]|jgi:regulator of RNase E activity RraA|nr:RraA family protein [Clostridiales bacterium]
MKFGAYEDIVQITKKWTGERLPDGRPKVSDDLLRRLRNITLEEAWGPLWTEGYHYQFEGEFRTTHKDTVLIGRAVTGVMVPKRPDLDSILIEYGEKEEGRRGTMNQWVIDQLIEDDVVVIDLFDKIYQGTFVGGNLSTAIHARTKRGGAVIWGGVRDLEQIIKIRDGHQTYYRGVDPTGIGDVTLVNLNGPCRIGKAICLPGDVVLGTVSGVLFIPPHLAEKCAVGAEKAHLRDMFAFGRLAEKVYTTAQVDTYWTSAMMEDFISWCDADPRAESYRHLNWDDELAEARDREKSGPQPAQIRL